jgi:hypothetical protein
MMTTTEINQRKLSVIFRELNALLDVFPARGTTIRTPATS